MINNLISYNPDRSNTRKLHSFKGGTAQKQPQIFVAMPMGKDTQSIAKWNRLNERIKSISRPIGYTAARIDDIWLEQATSKTNPSISDSILNKIDTSKIVIADLTERNPNVYFELGYALGRDKKILPIAKKGTDLPFDVKDYYTVFYENTGNSLKNKLGGILSRIYKNDGTNN